MRKIIIATLLTLFLLPIVSAATLKIDKYVVLNEYDPNGTYVPVNFYAGGFGTRNEIKAARTLLKFDTKQFENKEIFSASLNLDVSSNFNSEAQTLEIHRVLENWQKPTWNTQPVFDNTPIASLKINGPGVYGVSITNLVQEGVKSSNYGLLLKAENENTSNFKEFTTNSFLNITGSGDLTECEKQGATCKASCGKNEKTLDYSCNQNQLCCQKKGKPDLKVTNIKFDEIQGTDRLFDISAVFKNVGEISSGNYGFKAYLNEEEFVSSRNLESLKSGEKTQIALAVRPLSKNDTVKVIVDPANEINETNEGNNERIEYVDLIPINETNQTNMTNGTQINNTNQTNDTFIDQPYFVRSGINQTNLTNHTQINETNQTKKGNLKVKSKPRKADLYVDGDFKGKTPITVRKLAVGQHVVRLAKEDYLDFVTTLFIDADNTTKLNVILLPDLNQTNETQLNESGQRSAFRINDTNQTNATCTDSDGGKNYYVKGIAYDGGDYTDGGQDSCFTHFQYDHLVLNEYYCENEIVKSITYDCPQGCQNGACIRSNQTNETNNTCSAYCDTLDGWYDTGPSQWTPHKQCGEKEQLEQAYLDYTCIGINCTHSATNQRWQDTGNKRTIPNACPENQICDPDKFKCTGAIGTVKIKSKPKNKISLFIDGNLYDESRTPKKSPWKLELTPKKHSIRLTKEGYKDYEQEIKIKPNDDIKLTVKLKKSENLSKEIDQEPVCGDAACNGQETADSCYQDCGNCGDNICTKPHENKNKCYTDCGSCGDNKCTKKHEDANSCYQDCGSCGDGICSGSENTDSCYQDCGKCGDGVCSSSENANSCYTDCGFCGDNTCSGSETADNCYSDCGTCGDGVCSGDESCSSCTLDCGAPNAGQSCGTCGRGTVNSCGDCVGDYSECERGWYETGSTCGTCGTQENFCNGCSWTGRNRCVNENSCSDTQYCDSGSNTCADYTTGNLDIFSSPDGAEIYIDGRREGNTPNLVSDLGMGRHEISFRLSGYKDKIEYKRVDPGKTKRVRADLEPALGQLIVKSRPRADIFINNNHKGRTRFKQDITAGTHDIRLQRDGYHTYETSINVEAGSTQRIKVDLERSSGTLIIRSRPRNADVFIDGRYVGTTKHEEELYVGRYTIRIEKRNRETYEEIVEVEAGRKTRINPRLRRA